MPPHLPPEIIREIVGFLCSPVEIPEGLGARTKSLWSPIEPLTLASRAYRTLALATWFRTLFITDPKDIPILLNIFPEIGTRWTRELHCVQTGCFLTSIWDMCGFRSLRTVRLDWCSSYPMICHANGPAERLPFINVPPRVVELDIRGLTWPSPMIFDNIEKILPDLEVLSLRQKKIWCGLCHTCCPARFRAPGPDRIVYEGGFGLPMHYARAFSHLKHLHSVYITMADRGHGNMTLVDDAEHNPYLWAGECDRCMNLLYSDVEFRDRWVARKQGRTIDPKYSVYIIPPALNRVEWTFWKTEGSDESDDNAGDDGDEPGDTAYLTGAEIEDTTYLGDGHDG